MKLFKRVLILPVSVAAILVCAVMQTIAGAVWTLTGPSDFIAWLNRCSDKFVNGYVEPCIEWTTLD